MTVNTTTSDMQEKALLKNTVKGYGWEWYRSRKILFRLLIFCTLTLGAIWWFMRLPISDLREIARIKKLGGFVNTEFNDPGMTLSPILKELLDYLPKGRVRQIHFRGSKPTDEDLIGTFYHFQDLEFLTLSGTLVTDRIMEGISQQRRLMGLQLCGTPITDEGLTQLSQNRTIMFLMLDDTKITDRGVKEISKMTQLQTISLANTEVTDASVDFLLKIPLLHTLDIEGTKISEEGRARLTQKKRLTLHPGLSSF